MRSFLFSSFNENVNNLHLIYEASAIPEKKHDHDYLELVYVASGCMEHIIDDKKFECFRGDFLLIDTDSIHSFNLKPSASYFNLCLKIENIESTNEDYLFKNKDHLKNKIITFTGEDRREIENILQSMYIEERSNSFENKNVYDYYFNILCIKLMRKINEECNNKYDDWNKIINYIDNNLDENLTLQIFARKCFYNPSYFSRLFKAKQGITFNNYVNKKKIEKAKEYLETTNLSIEEISKKLGYSSIQVFYKTYSSFEKLSPLQYRNKNKK